MDKPEFILKSAREKRGLTQIEMAQLIANELGSSFSSRQYQKLESGDFPKRKTSIVRAIDKHLGTNLLFYVYEQNVPHETYTEHRRYLKNNKN